MRDVGEPAGDANAIGDARGQKASRQIGRRPDKAIKLAQPKSGEGVKL